MVKVHVAGAVALVAMGFMSLFIMIVGLVAFQRKRSMVSLVVSIIMCIYFAVCVGLFFISDGGKIISCTGGLIGCGILFLIFAWRWLCASDKRAFPHVFFMFVCAAAAGCIVAGYFN